jgi:hypothetical protein
VTPTNSGVTASPRTYRARSAVVCGGSPSQWFSQAVTLRYGPARRGINPEIISFAGIPLGTDGLELARKAVEFRLGLRVIYTTGGGRTDGMTALFVEDATFLPKPYTTKQLTEAVLATAEGQPR